MAFLITTTTSGTCWKSIRTRSRWTTRRSSANARKRVTAVATVAAAVEGWVPGLQPGARRSPSNYKLQLQLQLLERRLWVSVCLAGRCRIAGDGETHAGSDPFSERRRI
ncbi:protein of unknown function [Stenotrophomonas maltophilia]|nr:protein of unknown function [Stenotrophomonas maltophilia]